MARMNLTCCSRVAILLCSSVCDRRDLCSIFTCDTAVSFLYFCTAQKKKPSFAEKVVPPVEVQPISSSPSLNQRPWPPAPSSSSLLVWTMTFSPHTVPVWSKENIKNNPPHTHWTHFYSSCHRHSSLSDLRMNWADRSSWLRVKPWFTDCWVAPPAAAFWPPPARCTCPRTSSAVSRAAAAAWRPAASPTPAQPERSNSGKQRENDNSSTI